ncbi:uncharacterized protein BCR38DRAFT_462193 [Pseudomassariella vexata]|uniref:Nuclear distribution protein n=1 Tax=Pseudomassariella vexata TaxID=1141098 RepID=A0A1Y2D600_9PEZI|nr:uncharacterized protein BCR38DRAFT_462193 [Pseudomassariella vexata]ORY54712.1 hypothetical protein BCR38DRAFT_462193 [Pseudomassariella vexata]
MDLSETTLATLSHLESRLLRLEHLLYGHATPHPKYLPAGRDYAELLKIYNAHPALFDPPASSSPNPPPSLSPEAQRSIVLASASAYPTTASSLTSISDTPIPDAALSAHLAALLPRMKGVEATQMAQAAEIAELRARSEKLVRAWYEGGVMGYSDFVAGVEGRTQKVERAVRRAERARHEV